MQSFVVNTLKEPKIDPLYERQNKLVKGMDSGASLLGLQSLNPNFLIVQPLENSLTFLSLCSDL